MNRRARRKRRLIKGGVLLLLLLAVLAVVFLFQAKTVTVYGVTRHTEEEIKEASNYVTASNDEDGVAWAIEKLVLRREG